mgnify:FL=1
MKKILAFFLVVSMLLFGGCGTDNTGISGGENTSGPKKSNVTINVYNWGEYISNGEEDSLDVNEEFTKKTGVKVNYTTFQTNEELYAKLKSGSADYDVIIPSDYMIGKMVQEDMLEELDFSNIPNYEYIDPQFKGLEYDKEQKFSVPYTWGTVGIFYNKTMVDPEDVAAQSWDLLWNEKYSGKILMFDNPRDAFAIAQKRLGLSMNSTNPEDWNAAAAELTKQKPLVQAYVMDQIFDKMAGGDAAIAPYYAGDGIILMDENPDIEFYLPKEGTNRFVDAMCIPKGAKHKTEAEMYINFLCETEIAKANAEFIGYSTPQVKTKEILDPEIANNPIFYPSEEMLANTEVFSTLPEDINKVLSDLWIQLKK